MDQDDATPKPGESGTGTGELSEEQHLDEKSSTSSAAADIDFLARELWGSVMANDNGRPVQSNSNNDLDNESSDGDDSMEQSQGCQAADTFESGDEMLDGDIGAADAGAGAGAQGEGVVAFDRAGTDGETNTGAAGDTSVGDGQPPPDLHCLKSGGDYEEPTNIPMEVSGTQDDGKDAKLSSRSGVAGAGGLANFGPADDTTLGVGHPTSELEGLPGGGQEEHKKTAMEVDHDESSIIERKVIPEVDNSPHSNANDPPPINRAKSYDNERRYGNPNEVISEHFPPPQCVKRECPMCREVLEFRSERSAASGLKIHISSCTKRPKTKMHVDDAAEQDDSYPEAASNFQNNRLLYSITKDPLVCRSDLSMLKKRKRMVKHPDPRPCYNCTWCGPHQQKDVPGATETLCPSCKSLQKKGWFRWVKERAAKKTYVDQQNNRTFMSVRDFLENSTKLVRREMEQMTPAARSALFSQLYAIEEETQDTGTRKKSSKNIRKAPPNAPTKSNVRPKKGRLAKGSPSDTGKEKNPTTMQTKKAKARLAKKCSSSGTVLVQTNPNAVQAKSIVDGIPIPAFAKTIVSKLEKSVPESAFIPAFRLTTMAKRRGYVCQPDPRPAWFCAWCGVMPQVKKTPPSESGSDTLCIICESLHEFGWEERSNSSHSKYFFDMNQKRSPGVKDFLDVTTVAVCKAMQLLSPADHLELLAKFKLDQLEAKFIDMGGGQLKEDSVAGEIDEVQSLAEETPIADSIADFIKSKAKHVMAPLDKNAIYSSFELTTIQKRKQDVSDPDPRPAWGCEWCGAAKSKSTGSKNESERVCIICMALREHGWVMKHYATSQKSYFANKSYNGVKDYLKASTKIVGQAMKKMSRKDCLALQAQYDFTPAAGKKSPAKKKSKSSLSKRSSGTSDVSTKFEEEYKESSGTSTIELPTLSQLLEEKKGLVGVLEADVFQVYNSYFGTNASIAAKILMCLGKGQMPSSVSKEIPFLRSRDEIQSLSTEAPRFVGVFRVKRALGDVKDEVSFGVTVPQFFVNCEWSSRIERTRSGYISPKTATVNGKPLLLRIGIEDEDLAGKLFSFCYRVLYGQDAVLSILSERNPGSWPTPQDNNIAAVIPMPEIPTDPLDRTPPSKSNDKNTTSLQETPTDTHELIPPPKTGDEAAASIQMQEELSGSPGQQILPTKTLEEASASINIQETPPDQIQVTESGQRNTARSPINHGVTDQSADPLDQITPSEHVQSTSALLNDELADKSADPISPK